MTTTSATRCFRPTSAGGWQSSHPAAKTVILHRVEEAVEGALENVEREDDAAVLAERAIRETNQAITRRLTEEGVPAVSVQGSDHGLFEVDGGDSPQSVRAAGADWLRRTVGLGTIPVISPIARIAGEVALTRTVDPVDCATTLSSSLMAGGRRIGGGPLLFHAKGRPDCGQQDRRVVIFRRSRSAFRHP